MSDEKKVPLKDLRIVIEQLRHPFLADLNVDVSQDGILFVPAEVAACLRPNVLRSASMLLSFVHAFPSAFMLHLSWTHQEFNQAKAKLIAALTGHVDERFLHPAPPCPMPGMGAMAPEGHPVQQGYVVGQDLLLSYDPSTNLVTGDLNGRVSSGLLVLPLALERYLGSRHIVGAQRLMNHLFAVPEQFEHAFGWTPEQLDSARDVLVQMLRDILPDTVLDKPRSMHRSGTPPVQKDP